MLSSSHILTMTERLCSMWDIQNTDIRRIYQIKGLPDCSSPMTSNSIILNNFEPVGNNGVYQDLVNSSKPVHVLYCMAGHKISAGTIPSFIPQDRINLASSTKEGSETDVMRLTRSYFNDRTENKFTKNRLQITSACLLPMRRLMILGTQDGVIRVIV